MSKYTVSFIGTGAMGSALAAAAVKRVPPGRILLANRTPAKAEKLAAELGCAVGSVEEAAASADYIFLGVKPQMMAGLLEEIAPILSKRTDRFILVSMAAGVSIARVMELAGRKYPVIRIMPNTPCAVAVGHLYDCGRGCGRRSWTGSRRYGGRGSAGPPGGAAHRRRSAVAGCGRRCVSVSGGVGRRRHSLRPAPQKAGPMRRRCSRDGGAAAGTERIPAR